MTVPLHAAFIMTTEQGAQQHLLMMPDCLEHAANGCKQWLCLSQEVDHIDCIGIYTMNINESKTRLL